VSALNPIVVRCDRPANQRIHPNLGKIIPGDQEPRTVGLDFTIDNGLQSDR